MSQLPIIWPRKASENIAARIAASGSGSINFRPIPALDLGGNEEAR